MKNEITLKQRMDLLENEIKLLKSKMLKNSQQPWWHQIVGVFENDPEFEQISSLGSSIREQERPETQS